MHACVSCESKRERKKRDVCLVCSLCLSGYMGVFSDDVGWLAFFVWRSSSGVEKVGKMCKAPRNHKVRGRARREARVPVVETVHEMLLLRDWVQGVSATTAASKRARRCCSVAVLTCNSYCFFLFCFFFSEPRKRTSSTGVAPTRAH